MEVQECCLRRSVRYHCWFHNLSLSNLSSVSIWGLEARRESDLAWGRKKEPSPPLLVPDLSQTKTWTFARQRTFSLITASFTFTKASTTGPWTCCAETLYFTEKLILPHPVNSVLIFHLFVFSKCLGIRWFFFFSRVATYPSWGAGKKKKNLNKSGIFNSNENSVH